MSSRASSVEYRRDNSPAHRALAAHALLAISGTLFSLFGAVLTLGGLLSADGSAFYVLAGFGLILSGALVARGRRAGAWAYLAVFASTLIWALRNVELGGTPLALRLVGPVVLLGMLALVMPALRGWRPRQTLIVFTALMGGTVALGISLAAGGPLAASGASAIQLLDSEIIAVRAR